MRIDSSDSVATPWAGAHEAAELPARRTTKHASGSTTRDADIFAGAGAGAGAEHDDTTTRRAIDADALVTDAAHTNAEARTRKPLWWQSLARTARDAAIGVALISAVPLAVIAIMGRVVMPSPAALSDMRARVESAERLRALMAPVNASVTPLQAGVALHAVTAPRRAAANAMFPMHATPPASQRPWEHRPTAVGMFPPSNSQGLEAVVASQVVSHVGAFGPDEMAYLKRVAESPVWRDVDLVASAARIDVVAGAFVLPFRDDAFAPAMTIPRFADTKLLAYAGVSRAAYYLAIGQPERAEAALKSVVSFGYALIDNGPFALDAMIGRVIIDIGRDGLHQLYEATGNASGLALTAPLPKVAVRQFAARTAADNEPHVPTQSEFDAARRRIIAEIEDPQMPRSLRFNGLGSLALSTCGSVREVLFGPDDDVQRAFATARTTLARFPSEQAYLDLMANASERATMSGTRSGLGTMLLLGAASTASAVLHNPRIASCTMLMGSPY